MQKDKESQFDPSSESSTPQQTLTSAEDMGFTRDPEDSVEGITQAEEVTEDAQEESSNLDTAQSLYEEMVNGVTEEKFLVPTAYLAGSIKPENAYIEAASFAEAQFLTRPLNVPLVGPPDMPFVLANDVTGDEDFDEISEAFSLEEGDDDALIFEFFSKSPSDLFAAHPDHAKLPIVCACTHPRMPWGVPRTIDDGEEELTTHPFWNKPVPLVSPQEWHRYKANLAQQQIFKFREPDVYPAGKTRRLVSQFLHAGPASPHEDMVAFTAWCKKVTLYPEAEGVEALAIVAIDQVVFGDTTPPMQTTAGVIPPELVSLPKEGHNVTEDIKFRKGTTTVLAALPEMGKTYLATNSLASTAVKKGVKMWFGSVDEPNQGYDFPDDLEGHPLIEWIALGNIYPQTLQALQAYIVEKTEAERKAGQWPKMHKGKKIPLPTSHLIGIDGARTIFDRPDPSGSGRTESFGITSIAKSTLAALSRVYHPEMATILLITVGAGKQGFDKAYYEVLSGHSTGVLWMGEPRTITKGRLRYDPKTFNRDGSMQKNYSGVSTWGEEN